MSSILYAADVHAANHRKHGGRMHAGVNDRARHVLDGLTKTVCIANTRACDAIVVCGDLFDNVHAEPQLIARVGEAFAAARMPVYLLCGNHDMASAAEGDHANAPLRMLDNVQVVERPRVVIAANNTHLWLVPYASGNTSEWLPGELALLAAQYPGERDCVRMLALHAGIADDGTPPWLQGAHDSITADALFELMNTHGIAQAFAGNWHSHQSWSRGEPNIGGGGVDIVQCGALVPTGYDNPGLDGYGSVIVADGEVWDRTDVGGPRFLIVSGDDAREQYINAAQTLSPGTLHVRWKAKASQVGAALKQLAEDEIAFGLGGVDVTIDADDYNATVRAATASTQANAGEWQKALRTYVDEMSIPDGVDRDDVFVRTLTYLTR